MLIVYTERLARSASETSLRIRTPFKRGSKNESYNLVYGYFLETCKRIGLKVAFCSSADIVGAGTCSCYWSFQNKKWLKTKHACFSKVIFDKFSPTSDEIKARRKLLFSGCDIKAFNDPELFGLFFDKLKTYEKLSDCSIPTVAIEEKTAGGIIKARKKLDKLVKEHLFSDDFGQSVVLKDRFGAGGRRVFRFKTGINRKTYKTIKRNKKRSFIIQPFIKFKKGFSYHGEPKATDIRLIYLNGKTVQSYIREAKEGDFRCNEHAGGRLTYVPLKSLPDKLMETSDRVAKKLNKPDSMYALDFLVSNNGNIYLLEGNTGPGLDWNTSLKQNENEAKKLIRMVVNKFV